MQFLKNITIRAALLTILGIFCIMWAGVSLYTVTSLDTLTQNTKNSTELVNNMALISKGNDQYFRSVTRLSRAVAQLQADPSKGPEILIPPGNPSTGLHKRSPVLKRQRIRGWTILPFRNSLPVGKI